MYEVLKLDENSSTYWLGCRSWYSAKNLQNSYSIKIGLWQHSLRFSKTILFKASRHHTSHSFALGAFRTTPTESLYVEANEACLDIVESSSPFSMLSESNQTLQNQSLKLHFIKIQKSFLPNTILSHFGIRVASLLEQSSLELEWVHSAAKRRHGPFNER